MIFLERDEIIAKGKELRDTYLADPLNTFKKFHNVFYKMTALNKNGPTVDERANNMRRDFHLSEKIVRADFIMKIDKFIDDNGIQRFEGKYFDIIFLKAVEKEDCRYIVIRKPFIRKEDYILSYTTGYGKLDALCDIYSSMLSSSEHERTKMVDKFKLNLAYGLISKEDFISPEKSKKPLFNKICAEILLMGNTHESIVGAIEYATFRHNSRDEIYSIKGELRIDFKNNKTIFVDDYLDRLNALSMKYIKMSLGKFNCMGATERSSYVRHWINGCMFNFFDIKNKVRWESPDPEIGKDAVIDMIVRPKYILYYMHRPTVDNGFFFIRSADDKPGLSFEEWRKHIHDED